MKSSGNTQKNTQKTRVKGPYSIRETKLIHSWIYDGLKHLKNIGTRVNYEEFCQKIIDNIQTDIYAPEFISYWERWRDIFKNKQNPKKRKELFIKCIWDLHYKGLLPKDITGLTSDISLLISNILVTPPLEKDTTQ